MAWFAATPALAEPTITWRVENPFRLFGASELTQMHADALASLTETEKKTPVLSVERRLSAQYARGWASKMFRKDGASTCYNPVTDTYGDVPAGSRHHAVCQNYILPLSHRVAVQLTGAPGTIETCTWKLEYPGQPARQTASPCSEPVTLDTPYGLDVAGKVVQTRLSVSAGGTKLAETMMAVRDALIVALGDSFGSGEGNPDVPIEFNDARSLDYGKVGGVALSGRPARIGDYPSLSDFVKLEGNPSFYENRERWWDRQCHRSLYSHQVRVALQLAIEDPHRAVTFVSFSCSGAEIVDGLISRKATADCTPNLGDNVASAAELPAQMSALARALCVPGKLERNAVLPSTMTRRGAKGTTFTFLPSDGAGDWKKIDRCAKTNGQPSLARPIDMVLLSVGGNDIGFSGIVADAVLARGTPYRKLSAQFKVLKTENTARKAMKALSDKYFAVSAGLKFLFGVGGDKQPNVVLTSYPQMGYRKPGEFCSGTGGLETFPDFKFDAAKVRVAEERVVPGLLNVMKAAAKEHGWLFVDSFRSCGNGADCFENHGICAADDAAKEYLGFPIRTGTAWAPFNPSAYPPYQSRKRWFRTPNDAFLTSNSHTRALAAAQCKPNLTELGVSLGDANFRTSFQAFFASTYGGAFHPNAEGQAAIADAVLPAARTILAARGK